MDTVTEARLAIAIAQEGGIVWHKICAQQQAREVRAVKKFESGIIRDPVTITPSASGRAVQFDRDHGISGAVVDGAKLVAS